MSHDEARERLDTARDRHRHRSSARRRAVLAGGWGACALGLVILVPLPELGLLLLVVGLRLLALRYGWAARAYLPVARLWERINAFSTSAKIGLALVVVVIVGAIVWLLY